MPAELIELQGQRPIVISFNAAVNPQTAPALMGVAANASNQGHDEIHLMLSTPGGSVADGIAVYNSLRAMAPRIVTYDAGSKFYGAKAAKRANGSRHE